jgi:hypothetical protein
VAGPLRGHPGEAPWRVAHPSAQIHDQSKMKNLANTRTILATLSVPSPA